MRNATDNDSCTNTCAAATCGDGIVLAGVEPCDGDARLHRRVQARDVRRRLRPGAASSATTATRSTTTRASTTASRRSAATASCKRARTATTATPTTTTPARALASRRAAATACSGRWSRSATTATSCTTTAARSTAVPACGDGIVQANEECDDGNDARHGRMRRRTAGTRHAATASCGPASKAVTTAT